MASLTPSTVLPFWRLSGFYFFFFASLAALLPFWGIYLDRLGYSSEQIGTVFAVLMATKIVSPNIWGWIGDHTHRHMTVIRVAALFSLLLFGGVLIFPDYWGMLWVMMAFSFFWNATLPQFEAVTFHHLQGSHVHYSQVRLWGSVGFIVTVLGVGQYLKDDSAINTLPYFVLLCLLGLWLVSVFCPEKKQALHHDDTHSLWEVLKQSKVLVLLLACLLIQASHGPYYVFFSLYLEEHGYSSSAIAWMWTLSVASEVAIFLCAKTLFLRYRLANLLLWSIGLTALRWLLMAYFIDNLPVLLIVQCLHAASFALFHVVAIQLITEYFPQRLQGRGQGLYSSVSFGAGGAIGAYYGGQIWETQGGDTVFLIAAFISMLAFVCVLACKPLRCPRPVEVC